MKPYFKSPLHIVIFSVEMFVVTGLIASFILDASAWMMGYHHGFFGDNISFVKYFLIALAIMTPVFIIDLILFTIRSIRNKSSS